MNPSSANRLSVDPASAVEPELFAAPTNGAHAADAELSITLDDGQLNRRARLCFWTAVCLLTVLAAGLRFYRLDAPSMWIDELFTVRSSILMTQGQWLSKPAAHISTIVGMWLNGIDLASLQSEGFSAWRDAGITEGMLRTPTAIVGILSIPLLAWAARRMIGWRAALLMALLLTFSTWHLWMSQTARFYIQQFLLYNLCFLFYYEATREPDRRKSRQQFVAAGICLVLAFATQLTSLMIVAVFVADWLLSRVIGTRPVRLGRFGSAVIALAIITCLTMVGADFLEKPARYTQFEGSTQTWRDLALGLPFMLGIVLCTLAMLTALWQIRIRPRLTTYLLLGSFLPLITFMILAILGLDVHIRYVFVAAFSWMILAAIGLEGLWRAVEARYGRLMAAAPLLIVLASMVMADFSYYTGGRGFRAQWREAFQYVDARRQPGEQVAGDYIPSIVGQYYLRDPNVIRISASDPVAAQEQIHAATWIVVRGQSATGGQRLTWLEAETELRAYFATHILQPFSSVHVYHHAVDVAK